MDNRWKNAELSFEERTQILVDQMTLEEKVSQMTYLSSSIPRFGIPEYSWWNECLHGVGRAGTATMFPQPIGMAASFDTEQLFDVASIISDEARIKHHAAIAKEDRGIYKGLTMWTPNINIFRDPRWGRGHETYGEDPYLTARMGVSFIHGLQGDDPHYLKCCATAKHFAVHSGPEELRHEFDAVVGKKDMAETYLPAFKAAVVEAKTFSVMGAYNRVNGEAACASPTLLNDILRNQWGFDGYVVSDCGAIEDIYRKHQLVQTETQAAALAVNAGCDLCCGWVFPHLLEAAKQNLISEETISKSAYRLLLARFRLGMFDDDVAYANMPYERNDCDEHHQKSLAMARDTLVLLKNDGLLPLQKIELKTLAVIGPNADSRDALKGNYEGTSSETHTVLEGIKAALPHTRILFAEGCSLTGGSAEESWGENADYRISEALTAAEMADAVVLVIGLNGDKEGEEGYDSGDRTSMHLPESQRNLIDAMVTIDKPMVIVNMTGSATIFPHEEHFNAIIQAWYPGQMGGIAIADVLFGDYSPCGRLPVTFYASMDQVPDFSNYSMKNRTYRYMQESPAYPFGYGLSYTDFSYSDLYVTPVSNGLDLSVTVRNEGSITGKEVVEVYTQLMSPAFESPRHQLNGFTSVSIPQGESKTVTFHIDDEQLCVFNEDGEPCVHHGKVKLFVGGGQPDTRTLELTGKTQLQIEIER
jgi:beta-glucosidase